MSNISGVVARVFVDDLDTAIPLYQQLAQTTAVNQQLYAFVIDKLTERPEVADVRTSVIYEHLRNHAVAPAALP
jgi:hypothetical protein